MKKHELFIDALRKLGADNAAVIPRRELKTSTVFRDMCAANTCGVYGKCWMCPPDVGEIEELIDRLSAFEHVLVYQYISPLEDSFDVEGMHEARLRQYKVSQKLRSLFEAEGITQALHLSAGGCGVCPVCAKRTNEPCRHPQLAISSLEAYGIDVSAMAKSAGMRYINGADTVTYFGAVLFNLDE